MTILPAAHVDEDTFTRLVTLADYEREAAARFLRHRRHELWDFIAGGAGSEISLGRTPLAYQQIRLRPRAMADVSQVDTGVQILGHRWPIPVGIAPTALHQMCHPDGELATVRAAGDLGVPMIVSTFASTTIEEILAATDPARHPVYQQVYLFRQRSVTLDMARRAVEAGAAGLVVTVDSPWLGVRLRDRRNQLEMPAELRAANLAASLPEEPDISSPEAHSRDTMDPSATWDDVAHLVEAVDVPVLAKGILVAEDLKLARDAGAAGVIVSAHGGRQLDRALTPLEALPDIAAAAPEGYPILLDGGIRSGTDVVIALALGADAVLIGRPVLHGLTVAGPEGVRRVLHLLREQLVNVMGLLGRRTVGEIDDSAIALPPPSTAPHTLPWGAR